jgi:hypothetical protein
MAKWMAVMTMLFALPALAQPTAKQRELANELVALVDTVPVDVLDECDREVVKPDAVQKAVRGVLTEIYASKFNEAELAELIAFYSTATGRKLAKLSPELAREAAEKSKSVLAPLIARERDRLSPWISTMARMRLIGEALERYAVETGHYPDTDMIGLKRILVPSHLDELPMKDAWGNDYVYVRNSYGNHYRLISAGSDGSLEMGSREIPEEGDNVEEPLLTSDLTFDFIFADGIFKQIPRIAIGPDL